jgi:hypothetical protein
MTFWDPEDGVTTANSSYPRSELRELNPKGTAANWPVTGTSVLSATVAVVTVPDHVCIGQIHVPRGTKFRYEIALTGDGAGGATIAITVGAAQRTFPMPSGFVGYGLYFKAGDYDQTVGTDPTVGAIVKFYALDVAHTP